MSRNEYLANCREMGLRSHNPISSIWLCSDFSPGEEGDGGDGGGQGNEESSVCPSGPPHALPFSMALQPA